MSAMRPFNLFKLFCAHLSIFLFSSFQIHKFLLELCWRNSVLYFSGLIYSIVTFWPVDSIVFSRVNVRFLCEIVSSIISIYCMWAERRDTHVTPSLAFFSCHRPSSLIETSRWPPWRAAWNGVAGARGGIGGGGSDAISGALWTTLDETPSQVDDDDADVVDDPAAGGLPE